MNLVHDVLWLSFDRHFSQTWQIHKSQVDDMRRVDSQRYWRVTDSLCDATNFVCSLFDPLSYQIVVVHFLIRLVQKHAVISQILVLILRIFLDSPQLEHQWASCDDTLSSGQKVFTNDAL